MYPVGVDGAETEVLASELVSAAMLTGGGAYGPDPPVGPYGLT